MLCPMTPTSRMEISTRISVQAMFARGRKLTTIKNMPLGTVQNACSIFGDTCTCSLTSASRMLIFDCNAVSTRTRSMTLEDLHRHLNLVASMLISIRQVRNALACSGLTLTARQASQLQLLAALQEHLIWSPTSKVLRYLGCNTIVGALELT